MWGEVGGYVGERGVSSRGERSDGEPAGSDAPLTGRERQGAVTRGGVEVAGSGRALRPRSGVSCDAGGAGAAAAAVVAAAVAAAVEAVEAAAAATAAGVC